MPGKADLWLGGIGLELEMGPESILAMSSNPADGTVPLYNSVERLLRCRSKASVKVGKVTALLA